MVSLPFPSVPHGCTARPGANWQLKTLVVVCFLSVSGSISWLYYHHPADYSYFGHLKFWQIMYCHQSKLECWFKVTGSLLLLHSRPCRASTKGYGINTCLYPKYMKFIFFGGSKLLLPSWRPGSKTNFVVAKLYMFIFTPRSSWVV